MGASPSELQALTRKYRALRALREARGEPPTAELRALSREFPGALRELDLLSFEALEARLADVVTAERDGVTRAWILTMLAYHAHMRLLLAIKRRLAGERFPSHALAAAIAAELDEARAPVDAALVRRVANPPEGRLNRLAFQWLSEELAREQGELEHELFPRARGREAELTR